MKSVLERFLRYVSYDTMSRENAGQTPSTGGQLVLAMDLADELREMGLEGVAVSEYGYVTATLPANTEESLPVIGLIAHLDTSFEMSGKDVHPRIIENYDGADILLNEELDIWLKTAEFPDIRKYMGDTLITTDGTTLLGGDDKAGIAEIITALEILIEGPSRLHGTIRIAFTPDEEIGEGTDHFDVEAFAADYAYTVDGGPAGELTYENFNAAKAIVEIKGRNSHPGDAKNKMVNSILIGQEFNSMLPPAEVPQMTADYEGYFHLMSFSGTTEETRMAYLIRDFEIEGFNDRKELFQDIADDLNEKYGDGTVLILMDDQYNNMREKIMPVFHIVEKARSAIDAAGLTTVVKPIRGGTDGARLSFMGLPCPNLFTGAENVHGRFEFVPLSSMESAVEVLLRLLTV